MPEFIFRSTFLKQRGLVNFDLAWRSDTATVIKAAGTGEIITIPESKVLWRASGNNISTQLNNNINLRKNDSTVKFLNWSISFFENQGINMPIYDIIHTLVFQLLPTDSSYLSYKKDYPYIKGPIRSMLYYLMVLYREVRHLTLKDV